MIYGIRIFTNKYAIHAYTHGPVTGSGASVSHSPTGWAKGPPRPPSLPPLFSQCEVHGPPIGVGREKNVKMFCKKYTRLNCKSNKNGLNFKWIYNTLV